MACEPPVLTWVCPGRKGASMRRHADRTYTRSAAAVRDGKSLVQIEVADVRADVAGAGQTYLRVHVRAVHINLPAVFMDDGGDVLDGFLVHAVRAGVSHHQSGQVGLVQLGFFAQIGDIYVAFLVAFHHHDGHAAHRRAGGIRAMCRGRSMVLGRLALSICLLQWTSALLLSFSKMTAPYTRADRSLVKQF